MATVYDIAVLIKHAMIPENPIVVAKVVQDLGTNAETPMVTVALGEAERLAIYLPPHAITPEAGAFVARMGSDLSSPLIVFATNIQVGPWGGAGYGTAQWGSSPWGG